MSGCYRGRPSAKPPVHLNPNMDDQPKYEAMEASKFFENHAAMRVPVEGTVPRGWLRLDVEYYTGKTADGKLVKEIPVEVTLPMLQHGQERFNIYCSPCHGRAGDGKGIIVNRGYVPPPSFHQDRLRAVEDGHIFDVITNGIRNMPSYRHQIPVEDRWAIVAYFRALERSQNASADDVPPEVLKKLQK
jgi:mono/diheme cytochrome c family protein